LYYINYKGMNDHLARAGESLNQRCAEIAHHLDGLRHSIFPPLPRQPRPSAVDTPRIEAFIGGEGHHALSPGATASSNNAPQTLTHSSAATSGLSPITKEEIGRATWTFLHTLAAQYPEKPTRQQRRDAASLIDILTRMYPCGECARHFRAVVAEVPPRVASRQEFSLWMCQVHNVVNRSLGKPIFNCNLTNSRWSGIECDEEDACSLDLTGSPTRFKGSVVGRGA